MQLWQRMRTQTEAYWRDEFEVTDADIEFLYAAFLENQSPSTLAELGLLLVGRRSEEEEARLAAEMERGTLYRPEDSHHVGQELVMSAFDYAIGTVRSVRPGRNPRYGEFQVISVEIDGATREFASGFSDEHPLNASAAAAVEDEARQLGASQLFELFGEWVEERLSAALAADPEFVHLDEQWFLRSLLPEVHVGHLNLAEAIIAMTQRPVPADDFMGELEFSSDTSVDSQRFALELALFEDERFDELAANGKRLWYLYSLEPAAAVMTPARLRVFEARQPEALVLGELAEFVKEIGDELDEPEYAPGEVNAVAESASFILNYPHWREGTIPLTNDVIALLPQGQGDRFPVRFRTEPTGEEVRAWARLPERYAADLSEWYRAETISVGTTLTVTRTGAPDVLALGFARRPRKGEWIKEAEVVDGTVRFEMQRKAYSSEYDRNLVIHVDEPAPLDQLAADMEQRDLSLFEIMLAVAPELIKLSSTAVFHAKTLYAATNVLRRSGAVPIFVELTRRACFDPVGGGNWAYDPGLRDVLYATEEEMRERPHSKQPELIRDVVVPC